MEGAWLGHTSPSPPLEADGWTEAPPAPTSPDPGEGTAATCSSSLRAQSDKGDLALSPPLLVTSLCPQHSAQ